MGHKKINSELIIKFICLIITIFLIQANSVAMSAEEGTIKWSYPCWTETYAIGTDGTIYALCDDNLSAINPGGSQKWELDVDCPKNLSIGDDGTICLATCDALYAIRPDRSQKWKYPVTRVQDDSRPIAIGFDGTIYFVADRKLYAINSNGTRKWVFAEQFAGDVGLAVGADGTIYASGGDLYAINPKGVKRWRKSCVDGYSSALAIGGDGTIYAPCESNLEAINTDGSRKWLAAFREFDCPFSEWGLDCPVIDTDGTIIVINSNCQAFVNPENGFYSCRFREDTNWVGPITIGADGFNYQGVADSYGRIFLNGPGWELPSTYFGIITITKDGVLYVNEMDSEVKEPNILAINVNSKGLANHPGQRLAMMNDDPIV